MPADPDSITQEINWIHLKSLSCLNYLSTTVPTVDVSNNGWSLEENDMVVPIWFKGKQLPPSLRNCRERKNARKYDCYDGDNESPLTLYCRSCKKRKIQTHNSEVEAGNYEMIDFSSSI